MWDSATWSLSLGRLFGINIRVHIAFPVLAAGLVLRTAYMTGVPAGTWLDTLMLSILLLVVVLLHEFGHCFGARFVDGDAEQVILWPLGGLASVEVPQTPRANLLTAAAGPLANVVVCLVVGLAYCGLTHFELRPPWNPIPVGDWGWSPYRADPSGALKLSDWAGNAVLEHRLAIIILARAFWLSWVLCVLNVVVCGFPLDGGRILQCSLWPWLGYRQSMHWAIFVGFFMSVVVFVASIMLNELLLLCLAAFVFWCCRQQLIILETGGEDSAFGYDFSQGYTSLEGEDIAAPRPRRRQGLIQRWRQNRLARRVQRDQEVREAEERRMDELLEKVQHQGLQALTDEERHFLKRVSDKYRNRH